MCCHPCTRCQGSRRWLWPGAHAIVRLRNQLVPNFICANPPPGPGVEQARIQRSRRAKRGGTRRGTGENQGSGGNTRSLESIRTIFGQAVNENVNCDFEMQRWEVASEMFTRFTALASLCPPGGVCGSPRCWEDGLNLFVWGFLDWTPRRGNAGKAGRKRSKSCTGLFRD